MSKIHILEDVGNSEYKSALHTPTPLGNNSAGYTWKSVLLASGLSGSTILEVGTGPGDITQAEYDEIIAGDVVEVVSNLRADSGGATQASLDAMADKAIRQAKENAQITLKYYGYTQEV